MFKLRIHILNLPECELPDLVDDPCCLSTVSSTAKPPVNDRSSPLIISDDEAEQEKGFDDSLIILEDNEAPERNGNDEAEQEKGFDDSLIILEDKEAPERNGNDEAEQEKGFDDSLIILEDNDAPDRNVNGTDYGNEDVMILDEIPEKNADGMQTNTKGDQDKDKISDR